MRWPCASASVMAVTVYFLTRCPRSESTLHRYEVHPYGTLPVGPGPEFKTTLKVRSWGGAGGLALAGGGAEFWGKDWKGLSGFSGCYGKGDR